MSFLFPEDKGPSAAETLQKQRELAEKRRRGLDQLARENRLKGVRGQLLGARSINPSQTLPGGGE